MNLKTKEWRMYILPCLLLTPIAISQQRYLVTPTNEAIQLSNDESAIEVAKRFGIVPSMDPFVCSGKPTFGYPPNLYPPEVKFSARHIDVMGMWFVAPATGTIDTVFWITGNSVGALDSIIYIRVHNSNIGPNSGPGAVGYHSPCTPWGYWINSNNLDQGIAAFIEEATDTHWVSTVQGGQSSFPPFGQEIWGLGGYPVVNHADPINQTINRTALQGIGTRCDVEIGQLFIISMRVNSTNSPDPIGVPLWDSPTEWIANASQAVSPARNWKFYQHSGMPTASGCRGNMPQQSLPNGWWARGGPTGYNDAYVWNWWYTMTVTSNTPPTFISVDKLTHTLSNHSRDVRAEIEDCNAAHPESAGVAAAYLSYSINGVVWDSSTIPMTQIGGNTWAAFLPSAQPKSIVHYSITTRDLNGEASSTPWYSYKIIPLSSTYYTLDTNIVYNWMEVESTGTRISDWFISTPTQTADGPFQSYDPTNNGTAGPFDIGGTFKLFGSDVRYAWVGVDGALSLSITPTDTIRINLCPASYPKDIPSTCLPRNFISPFFNDLTVGDDAVYFQQDGSTFIVEWNSVRNSDDSTDTVTFQVILDRSDNSIIFQYNDVDISGLDTSALVGLQYEPTEKWFFVNQNGAPPELRPRNGRAIRFKPNFTLQVHAGWNLISNPALVSDERIGVLFADAVSQAFTFQNGYIRTDTVKHGRGYWLKFPKAQTLGINGDLRLSDTIKVKKGWNIIGSISVPVPTATIEGLPYGIVSGFTTYTSDNRYVPATTIEPGKGYWVKVPLDGVLVIRSQTSLKTEKIWK